MRQSHVYILLFFLLFSGLIHAGKLALDWEFQTTPSQGQSIETISQQAAKSWTKAGSEVIGAGFMPHTLWLHSHFTAPKDGGYTLELANPPIDHITLYLLRNDGHIEYYRAGTVIERADWQVPYHNQLFNLNLQAGEEVRIFLEIYGDESILARPRLFAPNDFAQQVRHDRIWTGIFIGIFLSLCLHCLMVWLGTHDRDFLNSFLFILGLGFLQCNLMGILHEYLFHHSPALMALSRTLLPALAFLAYIRFSQQFLNLAHFSPRTHRAFGLCTWLITGQVLIYAIKGNALSVPLVMLLGAILILLSIIAGFVAWSRGFRPARFYLMANTVLFAGGAVFILTSFNLIPATTGTIYAFHIGTVCEALLIAFSLSDKINTLQKERARAQSDRLSAEKKVIETLRESEAMLEDRVRERTEQLEASLQRQHEQAHALQISNQKLQTLNEDMNAYMSVAAHDLKNPTSAIIGFIDLLIERWDAWEASKKLDKLGNIRELAIHIHAIIRKLLDINAIESGAQTQAVEAIDLIKQSQRIANEYADPLERKNLQLTLQHPEQLLVEIDKDALLQILDNLLSNAIKYSPPGKKIRIELLSQGDHALIRVQDEGPGISAEEQEKLFRKFARLSARPTGGEHSTGLGLYIVKRLVESSGGQIRCESRLGEGTSFIVTLPLAIPDAQFTP